MIVLLLPFVLLAQTQAAQSPLDVRRMVLSSPTRLVQVSVEELGGEPDRLAWSPDGGRLYLRAVKTDRWGNRQVRYYEVVVAEHRVRPIEREPGWAAQYWDWKSALASPVSPDFRIDVQSRTERATATGIASAGALTQSGGDPSLGGEMGPQGQAIAKHAMQDQMVTTTTLTLRGQELAQFVNAVAIPGLTFGWAPAAMNAIAFADRKGRLIVMDRAGRMRQVPGAIDVSLPAWSASGTELAFVHRAGRGAFDLALVALSAK